MMNPKKLIKVLTGQCQHPMEERGKRADDGKILCMTCGEVLPDPTTEFRKLIRMNKHIRLRTGVPVDRENHAIAGAGYNVGLRYVVPGNPQAIRRVWIAFTTKVDQKAFAGQLDRRLRMCSTDESYNAVINEAVDIVVEENPEIKEQVIQRGDDTDNQA